MTLARWWAQYLPAVVGLVVGALAMHDIPTALLTCCALVGCLVAIDRTLAIRLTGSVWSDGP